ncbi:MAG: MBL fold metallo-hydrolase [Ramlibacter sp.]|nr:MBL fold metallo-hydrolase [Ramlibacter sp.]
MAGTQVQVKIVKIGQGDCILVTSPSGRLIVVDAGSLGGVSLREGYTVQDVRRSLWGGRLVPPRDIDLLVLTHHDRDHYNLLDEVLRGVPIRRCVYSGYLTNYSVLAFRKWYWGTSRVEPALFIGEPESISVNVATPTPQVVFNETTVNGQAFQLTVLASNYIPPGSNWDMGTTTAIPINTRSIVVQGTLAGNSFLLTGDATDLTEEFLNAQYGAGLHSQLIKVAHHGSGGSSSQPFVDNVQASHVVVSCRPQGTRFKHPRADVLQRWSTNPGIQRYEDLHTIAYWGGVGNQPPLAYHTVDDVDHAIWETGLNGTLTYVFDQDGDYYRLDGDDEEYDDGDGDVDDDPEDPDED